MTESALSHWPRKIAYLYFFFFQAEDGIRDDLVTGVQTCALPIWSPTVRTKPASVVNTSASWPGIAVMAPIAASLSPWAGSVSSLYATLTAGAGWFSLTNLGIRCASRSEERRGGKWCRVWVWVVR